jgi:mercuric ion transport protein
MKEGNASTFSAVGLTVLGTTCCALPLTLVALGAGGAVASMASTFPWLVALSQYKGLTFVFTASSLGYAWWRLSVVSECDIAEATRLRRQKWILRGASGLFGLSLFAAYALLPIVMWLDGAS